jgi:hypothetical protein
MGEPWLRGMDGAWLPSPQIQGVYNFTIHDLMMTNVKRWDKEKIHSLFPLNIANRIIETPLFDMVQDDKLIWVDNPHGNYTVKSGYNLLQTISGKVASSSTQIDWQSLWKINAPPKAKHFLWRMCKGCLPTRVRLQEKCVPCPLSCPTCDQGNEDDLHFVIDCHVSSQARQAAGIEQHLLPLFQNAGNVQELIIKICATLDTDTAGLFAMHMWLLWQNRNNKVWNDTNEPGHDLGIKARHAWSEWSTVQQVQRSTRRVEPQHVVTSWQKPPQGWYKCNIDAGFHRDINKVSTSWCVRDYLGRFVMAETTWVEGSCSVLEGEAVALCEALQALQLRGITHVMIESDSKSLVDALHHLRGGNSEFSSLVSYINTLLLSSPNFSVKFIKRQANMVAHTLARAAISWSSRCSIETLPYCISNLIFNEML